MDIKSLLDNKPASNQQKQQQQTTQLPAPRPAAVPAPSRNIPRQQSQSQPHHLPLPAQHQQQQRQPSPSQTSHPPPSPIHKATRTPRKKEQPLLQRAISSPRSSYHRLHQNPPPPTNTPPIFSNSSPFTATRRPTTTSFSVQIPNGDYRAQLAPNPPSHNRSPPIPASSDEMDYLADVAAMQHAQAPINGRLARNSISRENIRSSPSMPDFPPPQQYMRSAALIASSRSTPPLSRPRNGSLISGSDLPPLGGDSPTITPRQFATPSIPKSDLELLTQLAQKLHASSYSYETHIQLINILHRGLIAHTFPSGPKGIFYEPHLYPLLSEMRQARAAMDSRFPVGEDLWVQWIQDECMLARTVEDRVSVMELCQKAVQEEVGSARLWRLYGDWMWLLWKTTHDTTSTIDLNTLEEDPVVGRVLQRRRWTGDEKVVGQEIFSWNTMLDVWIQGMKAVEWHIDGSNLVWDPYIQILNHDLGRKPSPDKVKHVWTLFADRLQKPHASWPETFQGFSTFVSANYDESIYEGTMVAANKQSASSKHEYELRQDFELALQRATDAADKTAEWSIFSEYLEWELNQMKRKGSNSHAFDLYVALLERVNLRFPTVAELWEDHVDLIMDHPDSPYDLLSLVHRASRHCPWSGNLWSKHLLAYEAANRPFVELEDIKHRATSTGLLEEMCGMDEVIKVYTAWCGFLRRRANGPNSGDDEHDVAEMGIRSVIENVNDIGSRMYGDSFTGDPSFRAEKIYIKFLSQLGRYDEARDNWHKLIDTHGHLFDFWDRFYFWEMTVWGKLASSLNVAPEHATNVLRQGARRPNLDEPEKMVDLYLHHCGQHESIARLQEAHTEARRARKLLAKRREREAAEVAEVAAHVQPAPEVAYPAAPVVSIDEAAISAKRKREEEQTQAPPIKRVRSSEPDFARPIPPDGPLDTTLQVKRDRENSTLIVKQLPATATEAQVRRFFRDCGDIITIQIVQDDKSDTKIATVEFGSKEDLLAAQTRSMKPFEGQTIDIQAGTDTTLFVTNYIPEADEEYIKSLFKECGSVVDVRFPSLKFNTHRRFCYVQLRTSDETNAAVATLHGKHIDGLNLQVKISDPSAKNDRTGAIVEGREVFAKNLHFKITEAELRRFFEEKGHGNIERVRIPRSMQGSKGSGFIRFYEKKDADAAISEMDKIEFRGRCLHIEPAVEHPNAKRVATIIINNAASATPEASIPSVSTPVGGDTVMTEITSEASGQAAKPIRDHHSRTLLLRNIPDTVNDARIKSLMSSYGPLKKITLRPEKEQAIVEFEDIRDSGKAELGVQGHEIVSGVKIEVGRLDDEQKSSHGHGHVQLNSKSVFNPIQVRRPGQGPTRGGRGGLGFKSAAIASTPASKGVKMSKGNEGHGDFPADETGTAKSNADFRAMISK